MFFSGPLFSISLTFWSLVNGLDEYSTYRGQKIPGVHEANPLAFLKDSNGKLIFWRGLVFKIAVTGAIFSLAYGTRSAILAPLFFLIIGPIVLRGVINNFLIIRKYGGKK